MAWCAAALFAILSRAGISIAAIPRKDRLLVRSALLIGTPVAEPRCGCVAVLPRNGNSWQAHTGILTAVTKTRVKVLVGNQSNAINNITSPVSQSRSRRTRCRHDEIFRAFV